MVALYPLGCFPELEQIPGERLLYEHPESVHPCAGTAEWMDGMIPFLEVQLRVTAPAPVRYTWIGLDNAVDYSLDVQGATIGGHIYGTPPDLTHEMVHLVATPGTARFFEEGLAMAHDFAGGPLGSRYPNPNGLDPRPTMTARTSKEVDYRAAGLFVAFLLTRHGPDRFRDFRRTILSPRSMKHIRSRFLAVYGRELDDEVEEFMRGGWDCPSNYFAIQLVECGTPPVAWETPSWRFEDILDCDSPGVVGGYSADYAWPSHRAVTLDLPASGRFELSVSGDPAVIVRFGPCFGCIWDIDDQVLQSGDIRTLDLTSGRYYARVSASAELSPDFAVTLTPQ